MSRILVISIDSGQAEEVELDDRTEDVLETIEYLTRTPLRQVVYEALFRHAEAVLHGSDDFADSVLKLVRLRRDRRQDPPVVAE